MDRRGRVLVTTVVVAALFVPVAIDADGFPLSTYPMYARARSRTVTLATAQAVDAEGTPQTLTLALIGESDDPLIVAGELRDAIAEGRAEERCTGIAARVRRAELDHEPVAVEVVTERHDVVARSSGDASVLERTVHARCEVPR